MKFKHKPKLGDIIYSLPTIKFMGGGVLYLDPDSKFFPGEREQWIEKYNWLMPLLKIQDYITDVKIYEGEEYDINLDQYMDTTHLNYQDKVSIVDNHFIGQGLDPQPYKSWLKVDKLRVSKIIVANSGNHTAEIDYKKILKGKIFTFVGTEQEAYNFGHKTGLMFSHYITSSSIMLAAIIDGCQTFIGNQSLPLAVALGLGKECWVEESTAWPNCIMGNYKKLSDSNI